MPREHTKGKMKGWLVNDRLTCVPGTRTFWHDLLEWLPSLEDKTDGHTPFHVLHLKINNDAYTMGYPDYVIRNATFFPKLDLRTKTISFLQDRQEDISQQLEVCNSSDVVVFNSPYTKSLYEEYITVPTETIVIGTDFEKFKPGNAHPAVLPNSVVFVGAANSYPKGFDSFLQVALKLPKNYNFCLVMKDGFSKDQLPLELQDRAVVFNNIRQEMLCEIYNSCAIMLCTSKEETLHLAGVEAGACDLPIIATNVGVYFNRPEGEWGSVARSVDEFVTKAQQVRTGSPRQYWLGEGYDRDSCKKKWRQLIK